MRKTNNSTTIECRYFKWRLRTRNNGMWQADARGNNKLKGKRHSLGTRDFDEAKRLVHQLDEQTAAEQGLISYQALFNRSEFSLPIEAGIAAYHEHIERPRAAGGPKEDTSKRYRRIIRAFVAFLQSKNIQYFEQISKGVLDDFAAYRSGACQDSTIKLELTSVRGILNFLRDEKLLAADTYFRYRTKNGKKMKRRYCPLYEEAKAILQALQGQSALLWLFQAVMMLVNTGLRLSELAQMTSHDVDLELGVIWVRDEEEDETSNKETKTGEDRFVPITTELRPLLEQLVTPDNQRLFNGPRGGRLISDTINDGLRANALVPLKERFLHARFQTITAHCLRHFFRTHATNCGISKTEIDAWMGHNEQSMSQRYFHANIESACHSIKKFKPILATESELDSQADKS